MATFDLSTPKGRYDFSTNKTLEYAFKQAVIETCADSIKNQGDGTQFPYLGKEAYNKINPFLLRVFKSGLTVNRDLLTAFIVLLPTIEVDEDLITTTLYAQLKGFVKEWIELSNGVSEADKV